jgi:hypothetical protein
MLARFIDTDAVVIDDGTWRYELYRANVSRTWDVVWVTGPGDEARHPPESGPYRATREMLDAIAVAEESRA